MIFNTVQINVSLPVVTADTWLWIACLGSNITTRGHSATIPSGYFRWNFYRMWRQALKDLIHLTRIERIIVWTHSRQLTAGHRPWKRNGLNSTKQSSYLIARLEYVRYGNPVGVLKPGPTNFNRYHWLKRQHPASRMYSIVRTDKPRNIIVYSTRRV